MLSIIKHFVQNNYETVINKSFLNCHVHGLHSIMLHDVDGQRIRLFIT